VSIFVLVIVLLAASVGGAAARTWRVEKDGSGDFTVIQEAVDVAASGDTVRIGVGRFDDKRYYTFPGWSDSVRVVVHQYELTIIGSGPETTIGQEEPWSLDQGHHGGIIAGQVAGVLDNSILKVEMIKFENMGRGVDTSHESTDGCSIEIRDCQFKACRWPVALYSTVGGTVLIANCSFDRIARNDSAIHCWWQDSVVISNCLSTLDINPTWNQEHFGSWNVGSVVLEGCVFVGGTNAADFFSSESVVVRNCEFDGQELLALEPLDDTLVFVEDCVFDNQERAIEAASPSGGLCMERCIVGSVDDCSFLVSYTSSIVVRDSDIGHGVRGAVWINDIPNCDFPLTLDFTYNYWYTDDRDIIATWIHDQTDSEQACYFVNFEPFRDESTPVDQSSLSEIKSLFR
jgi:hypothetical protein